MTRSQPNRRSFLTAEWRDLVLLNYRVDPALLAPHVPRGTELDAWNGDALVSLVGFRFIHTRVLGLALPWHQHFTEVNLRFYVRRRESGRWRRAVVFLRELVPRTAIAVVARLAYNEPYRALPMRAVAERSPIHQVLRYEWHDRDWVGFEAETSGESVPLKAESAAEFITEHFWGYTRQRDGGTVEYEVAHPSWRVWESPVVRVIGDLSPTYGQEFGRVLAGSAHSAFVAEGSPVVVYRPRRLTSDEWRAGTG